MVKTKCLFDQPEDSDGTRIVVAYKLPSKNYLSRFNAEWELAMAPDVTAVRAYKSGGITWKEYTELYLAKMALPDAAEVISKWAKFAIDGTITLLCYEREGNPHCHRHLLKKLINKKIAAMAPLEEEDDGHTSLGEEQAMRQFGIL